MKCYIYTFLILILLFTSSAFTDNMPLIHAKLASAEIEGDLMTVWSRKFAKHMKIITDGKFDLTVYPYGTIGSSMNINQLCQLGTIDFVFAGAAYLGPFVPEVDLLNIHYLWPVDNLDKILKYIVSEGKFFKILTKSFQEKGLYPLTIFFEGWQWITSKKPIIHLKDVKDVKIRVMASKMLIEQYRLYGFSPTTMDYGEIYSSLQTGVLDAQVQPMFANYSMKFYEVAPKLTQMRAEPFLGIPVVNNMFFQGLPKSIKDEILNFWQNEITPSYNWIKEKNANDRLKISSEKSEAEFFEFNKKDIEKAKIIISKNIENKINKLINNKSKNMLELLKTDIEKAINYLNNKKTIF